MQLEHQQTKQLTKTLHGSHIHYKHENINSIIYSLFTSVLWTFTIYVQLKFVWNGFLQSILQESVSWIHWILGSKWQWRKRNIFQRGAKTLFLIFPRLEISFFPVEIPPPFFLHPKQISVISKSESFFSSPFSLFFFASIFPVCQKKISWWKTSGGHSAPCPGAPLAC